MSADAHGKEAAMHMWTLALALLMTVSSATGDDGNGAAAAFDRLKSLAGEWHTTVNGVPAQLTYELVANGTTLLERESGGNRPTMLTLYHRDGDRLLLTHYCMAGNQPRMQARAYDAAAATLAFDFIDGTNMPNAAAGHMHSTTIHFVDAQHIDTEWQYYQNGKPTMVERAQYTRSAQR